MCDVALNTSGRELRHAMAMLDANSNGQVTRQEFEDGLRDCRCVCMGVCEVEHQKFS